MNGIQRNIPWDVIKLRFSPSGAPNFQQTRNCVIKSRDFWKMFERNGGLARWENHWKYYPINGGLVRCKKHRSMAAEFSSMEVTTRPKNSKAGEKLVDPKNIGLMNQHLKMVYFFRFITLQGSSNKSSWSDSASDADLGPLVAHGSWAHPQARQEFTVAILFRLDLMPQGTNEGVQVLR